MSVAPRVGFIGLGIMGRPMARHLLEGGFPVIVHNRSRAPVDALAELGAIPANNPAEVASQAEIVITCLPDDATIMEVWQTGEHAALPKMRPGSIGVDMSTTSPNTARTLAGYARQLNLFFLDAPVTGGQWGAEAGTLTIMVGGDARAFERCLPVFQAMGKKIVLVGQSGMGQTLKLANQIAVTVTMQAVSEALLFAKSTGIDLKLTLEVLGSGAAGSWAMENLGARIADRNFEPGFMVRLLQKDLRLLLEEAEHLKLPLPGTALTHQLLRHLEATGEEKLGIHALTLVLERLAGKGSED